MNFHDLQDKISALITEYNDSVGTFSDERVTTAQLHLARPATRCTTEEPGLVFVTPTEFSGMAADQPERQSLSAAAAAASSPTECCAAGWKGVVWNGVFVNCFPTPGLCGDFKGPNTCEVPGG